jgi:hypothetical protein
VTTELRGLPLLDAAIDHIEKHPEEWDQSQWRCKTGMCLAGHIVILAGGKWAHPERPESFLLVQEPGERSDIGDGKVRASVRAERLLGAGARFPDCNGNCDDGDGSECRDLFDSNNTLDDIKGMRNELYAMAIDRAEAFRDGEVAQ